MFEVILFSFCFHFYLDSLQLFSNNIKLFCLLFSSYSSLQFCQFYQMTVWFHKSYLIKDLYLFWKGAKASCNHRMLIGGTCNNKYIVTETAIPENRHKSSHWESSSINILETFPPFFMNIYLLLRQSFIT